MFSTVWPYSGVFAKSIKHIGTPGFDGSVGTDCEVPSTNLPISDNWSVDCEWYSASWTVGTAVNLVLDDFPFCSITSIEASGTYQGRDASLLPSAWNEVEYGGIFGLGNP